MIQVYQIAFDMPTEPAMPMELVFGKTTLARDSAGTYRAIGDTGTFNYYSVKSEFCGQTSWRNWTVQWQNNDKGSQPVCAKEVAKALRDHLIAQFNSDTVENLPVGDYPR